MIESATQVRTPAASNGGAPTPALPPTDQMQRAMLDGDASYDGVFFVCVTSTGIFCRPSCPARKPRVENARFLGTVRDCLLAGYRPCKRCRPLAVDGSPPEWLATVLDRVEADPAGRISDQELTDLGVSPYRVRRYFLRNFDMTFQAYHRARRMGLALNALRQGENPLHVALDCGYDSNSGFRDAFEKTFGTTPGRSGDLAVVHTRSIESPLGPLVAGATDDGVCLLEFADRRALQRQVAVLKRRLGAAVLPGENAHLVRLAAELDEYFAGRRRAFTVPLVRPGTEFQHRVWDELVRIPFGQTCSYADVAARIGRPTAHRAVARANGDNRIAIVIPCHRVVRHDGSLSGYGGGLWRKQRLLELEAAATRRR